MKAAIRAHRFTDTVNVVTSFLSWLDQGHIALTNVRVSAFLALDFSWKL